MKRTTLLSALKVAAPSLGKEDKALLPALTHFCFEDDQFYAYDDQTAVIVGLKTGLTVGLHGETLLGVLEASRTEDVEVKVKGSTATISGAGRVELPVLDRGDFVFSLPNEEPILSVPLAQDIKRALEICLISVTEDSLRPEYNGVTLRIGKSGTVLFSTDNLTASRMAPQGAKVIARKEAAVVLPKGAAELILKLFPEEGKPKMHLTEHIAIIEFGGAPEVTLITKLLGQPSEVLDKIFEQHVDGVGGCKLPEGLDAEIRKAQVLTSRDSLKECTIVAERGQLVVSVSAVLGKMRAVLELPDKKLVGSVVVDPNYVARLLPYVSMLHINDGRSLVLRAEGLDHIISTVPKAVPAAEEVSKPQGKVVRSVDDIDPDADIPF